MLRCNAACRCCGLSILLALCLGLGTSAVTPPGLSEASGPGVFGARYPALSPDGRMVTFEYWGDIWLAPVDLPGPAIRLTDHAAWDSLPRFSPDGKQIAFNSTRSGNTDIWVMPAGGGTARQVTTHSGNEVLDAWLPNGSGLLFHSNRGQWSSDIYSVPVPASGSANTGEETQLTASDHEALTWAQPLPGGGLVVNRGGGGRWWRKRYRGSAQNDIWRIAAPRQGERWGKLSPVVQSDGRDDWPCVSGDGIWLYYVSDEDGIDNIWAKKLNDDVRRQVTHYTTDGVQWPSIQPGGSQIVYEFDGQIWIVDGAGGDPRQLDLSVLAEGKDNLTKRVSFSDAAGDYTVSPNGKYVVFEYQGDLWAIRDPETYGKDTPPDQDLSRALRLTPTDAARERYPAFAPDSRHLAYSSDADGNYNLYVMDLADLSTRKISAGSGDHLHATFDPSNGDYLFANCNNVELRRFNLKDGSHNLVAQGNFRGSFGYYGFDVSPDGKWVAYVEEQHDWSSEILVVDAAGTSKPVNITRDPNSDNSPRWSPDGSRLVWRSDRENDETAFYAVELNPQQLPITTDFFLVEEADMKHGDQAGEGKSKTEEGKAKDEAAAKPDDAEKQVEAGKEQPGDKDKAKKKVEVKINFEDIHFRARRLTRQSNTGSGILSQDGKWLIYQADPDGTAPKLWAIRADPRPQGAKPDSYEAAKVQDGGWSSPQLASDGKRIYYMESSGGGRGFGGGGSMASSGSPIRYAKFGDGKISGKESISFKGDYTLDRRARWGQMLREGWHVLGQRFYDPSHHGVDWNAVYSKYARYIDHIGTPEEFELMFSELLGELNASHLGIGMAESSYNAPGPGTGHLGLELSDGTQSLAFPGTSSKPSSGPGLIVTHITYRGPADQQGVDLALGDTVLSIDGTPIGPGLRWYDLLTDKAGLPVKLSVRKAGDTGSKDVLLKAISWGQYQSLLYREWEKLNEDKVAALSDGRIGYIHIAAMSRSELRKFEREFFTEMHDKEGLLVDVRFNGGGNIHEELFEHLDRQLFSWNAPRDVPWKLQPSRAFNKPKALLINARSGSDAEIFPAGWRRLGLGPVIGISTAGAVIGTSGFTLVDGSSVRLPMEGWYELDGRNLETDCTAPDVRIEQDPNGLRQGEDAQLEAAVALLLKALEETPPAPPPPAAWPAPR